MWLLSNDEINAIPMANPRLVAQAQLRKVVEILRQPPFHNFNFGSVPFHNFGSVPFSVFKLMLEEAGMEEWQS